VFWVVVRLFGVRFWREWWKRVVPWRQFAEVEEIRILERIPRSEMYELIERCIFSLVLVADPVRAIVDPVSISAFNELLLFARGNKKYINPLRSSSSRSCRDIEFREIKAPPIVTGIIYR
jgi:hypothetical protein